LAIAASFIVGLAVVSVYGGLSEANMKLFEGIAALVAVAVLTSMIIWMALRGKTIKDDLENEVDSALKRNTAFALVGFSFIVIFREGFETVLFLTPFGINDTYGTFMGAFAGLVSAFIIAYFIFRVGKRIDIGSFFYFSSILLIFLAAGLAGYGVHELIEYRELTGQELGWFGSYAYDLGFEKGSILHHKGAFGSIIAVMFGYSVKMEWGRVIIHLAYLGIFLPLNILAYKNPESLKFFIRTGTRMRVFLTRSNKALNKD